MFNRDHTVIDYNICNLGHNYRFVVLELALIPKVYLKCLFSNGSVLKLRAIAMVTNPTNCSALTLAQIYYPFSLFY